jgi:hypothetical protein
MPKKEDQKGYPKTDFTIKPEKKKELPPAGPERSKGTIDLKSARRQISRWQAPNRKV